MDVKADVVFVNDLVVSGFLNGVINMAFASLQFVPDIEASNGEAGEPIYRQVVAPAPVITANLRFDLHLAQVLHDRLGQIIEENTRPAPKATN